MATANLALRFVAELAAIGAVGYAAFQVAAPLPVRVAAGAAAALGLIAVWWLVVAPNAASGLTQPQKDVIGSAILLLAAGVLALAGQQGLAIGFAIVVVVNAGLLFAFGADARERLVGAAR